MHRARACSIGLAIFAFASTPARASAATTPVTPTTISQKQLNKQTTDTLRPLVIWGVVIFALSAVAKEVGRTRRRRRRSRKRPRSRQPSPRRAPPKPKRRRAPRPDSRQVLPTALPPPTAPTETGHMWGRTAGASAAERADELERERARWAEGAAGEHRVGSELDQLSAGAWWVFHDLPRGPSGTNVDHLVIGVGGVFTVNTKNLAGNVWVGERALMVDGVTTNYLPVAVSEAHDVARRLSLAASGAVQVHPLLVFLEPATIKAMPHDVTVLHVGNVRDWLQSRTRVLTPRQAYEVVLAGDRPTTWT